MQRELDKIAAFMLANTGSKLFIEGHTDVFGTLDEHTKVSEQRANEVLSYMVRKGIAKSRLFASGKGSLQPLADNATEAGRKKNRRVELRVITQ
jgi:outer membrane protein OmpA-like peptidoglycan-associated protein